MDITNKIKTDCYNCKYIKFDSSFDGYCSNNKCSFYRFLVLNDKGCRVISCGHFKEKCEQNNVK